MNELITIHGVRGFVDKNGTVQLSLEDVARGLGFTDTSKGTEYVRWNTVNTYLADMRISQEVAKDSFIPENIFYRLAMKAKNETAEIFQAKVCDEILPSIRKHGMYATDELLDNPDLLIQVATRLKEEKAKTALLITENKLLAGQALTWTNRKILEAIVKKYGAYLDKHTDPSVNGFQEAWREFKKELLYAHRISLNERITANTKGKKSPRTLDMIHEEELPDCISTAVALCNRNNVDISEILSKVA